MDDSTKPHHAADDGAPFLSSPAAPFPKSRPDDDFEAFADLYRRHGPVISNELRKFVDDEEWAETTRDVLFFKMMLHRRP